MQMRRTQIGGISVAKKYLLSVLLLAVLFLPHFNVEYLQRFSFSRVLTAMRYLSLFVMLLGIISWVLMYRGRLNYSIFVLLAFYTATIALSTVINRGDLFEALQSYLIRYLPLLFLSLLLQLYPYYAVQALYIILEILCLANLVSMVLYPEGLYLSELTNNRCFLLGHKNSVGYFTVALLALSIYKNHLKNRREYGK